MSLSSSIISFGHASPEIRPFAALLPVATRSPLSQTLNASSKVPAEARSVALLLRALSPALLLHQRGHTQSFWGSEPDSFLFVSKGLNQCLTLSKHKATAHKLMEDQMLNYWQVWTSSNSRALSSDSYQCWHCSVLRKCLLHGRTHRWRAEITQGTSVSQLWL